MKLMMNPLVLVQLSQQSAAGNAFALSDALLQISFTTLQKNGSEFIALSTIQSVWILEQHNTIKKLFTVSLEIVSSPPGQHTHVSEGYVERHHLFIELTILSILCFCSDQLFIHSEISNVQCVCQLFDRRTHLYRTPLTTNENAFTVDFSQSHYCTACMMLIGIYCSCWG